MIISSRQEKIIKILLEKNKVATGDELCTAICVSSRTIRSDIKGLNKIIEKEGAVIQSEKGKGYYIEIFDEKKFKNFYNMSNEDNSMILNTEDRVEYIIMRLLINELNGEDGITQSALADELYISLSSLKKDIKIAKSVLEKMSLDIEKNGNKGIIISGNEEYIRRASVSYLLIQNTYFENEFKKVFEKSFTGKRIREINEILKEAILEHDLRLTDIAYNSFLNDLVIMIFRNHNKKYIGYNDDIKSNLERHEQTTIANSICNFIERNLDINLDDEEIYYITMHLISSSLMKSTSTENISLGQIRQENLIVSAILNDILENYKLDLIQDKILINFLENHLKGAINRAKYNIKIENTMLKTIKNNYPFAFEMGILASRVINNYIGVNLSEDDIGFVALHFAASLERLKDKDEVKIKRVMLVCTTGVGTSLLLKVKLETKFKDRIAIIDTIPWYEFKEDMINNIDFIITTIPLEVDSKKVIHIKNLLDENEEKLIEDTINIKTTNTNMMSSSFKEDIYIRDLDISNKYEALHEITEVLVSKGYISNDVKEAFYSREELASTEIGNLVAIPHTMHDDIKEFFICVAVLKKSILWDKENVQVVFLIGLNKKEQHRFKYQLEKLYKNIMDIGFVLDIIKTENYDELIRLLN